MTTAIILLLIFIVAAYFIFRKKQPVHLPTDSVTNESFSDLLGQHIAYYTKLTAAEKERFSALVTNFLSDVIIEGVGIEITDTDRIMIASSAVIPIFGFPEWHYNNLTNIILYPNAFNNDFQFENGAGEMTGLIGGGFMNGQMLLSRAALVKGFSKNNGKENTALHEFVHLLDNADGATDGLPDALLDHDYAKPWLQMIHKETHRISDGHSDINPYALTNEAEFLAVCSEYFFEKPDQFKTKHPELYQQLSKVFNQDPATPSVPN